MVVLTSAPGQASAGHAFAEAAFFKEITFLATEKAVGEAVGYLN